MSFRHYTAPDNPVSVHNVSPDKPEAPKGSFGTASLADYIKFEGDPNRYTRAYLKEELKKIPFEDISILTNFFSTKGAELRKSSQVQASSEVPVLAGVPEEANIKLPAEISNSLLSLSKLSSESDYTMVLSNESDIPANLDNAILDIVELGTVVIVAGVFFVIVLPSVFLSYVLCYIEDPEDPNPEKCLQALEVDLETLGIDLEQKCESNGADCKDEVKKWAYQLVTKVKDVRNGADTDITDDSYAEQLDYMPIRKLLKIYSSDQPFQFLKKPVEGEAPSNTNYTYVTTTVPLGTDKWALTLLTETL
jgi:hypothetical protein